MRSENPVRGCHMAVVKRVRPRAQARSVNMLQSVPAPSARASPSTPAPQSARRAFGSTGLRPAIAVGRHSKKPATHSG